MQTQKALGANPYRVSTFPEEWDYIRLGQDFSGDFINGLNKDKEDYGHGVPHVNIDNIFEDFVIDVRKLGKVNANEKEISRYSLRKGDICLLRSSVRIQGVGYPALFDSDVNGVVFSGFIIRFRPISTYWDSRFLTYILRSGFIRNNVIAWATISANINVNQESLKKILVPHPPLKEQQKIASILSKVDELIQKTDQVIEQTQRLKKGLMLRLLTKGIGHTKFKKTQIGEIPDKWKIVELFEVVSDFKNGGTPSTSNSSYWNGEIPWIRSAWSKDQHYIVSGEKYITRLAIQNSSTTVVPSNNILIATRVTLGNVAINKIDIAINQDITGIIIDRSKVDKEFLYWMLMKIEHVFRSFSQGTTIGGIKREDLKKIRILLPDLKEQQRIASVLSRLDDLLQNHRDYRSKIDYLKKGLMQKLLTGKIRVKI